MPISESNEITIIIMKYSAAVAGIYYMLSALNVHAYIDNKHIGMGEPSYRVHEGPKRKLVTVKVTRIQYSGYLPKRGW